MREQWTKNKNGKPDSMPSEVPNIDTFSKMLPPGEPPICCPDTRKNPSVTKPVFPSGTYQCPPEEGGCGSTWTKEGR